MKQSKTKAISLALLLFATISASAQTQFTLTLKDDHQGAENKYLIYMADEKHQLPQHPTDSFVTKKHKYTYKTNLSTPRQAIVQLVDAQSGKPSNTHTTTFFIPGETCQITLNANDFRITGTSFYQQSQSVYDVYAPYDKQAYALYDKYKSVKTDYPAEKRDSAARAIIDAYNANTNKMREALSSHAQCHHNEEGCIITMLQIIGTDPEGVYAQASEEVKNGRFKDYITATVDKARAVRQKREKAEAESQAAAQKSSEGQMFVDFEATHNGKTHKLSDYVGKGKYVLVDFWASWCGPCKAEIPTLIQVYNKYKGDNFEVLGVATWDKPEATEKAIEQMHIPYPQILNAGRAGSDAYGIRGIPQIILFGPDGKILQRDLRGEKIEECVKKYLGK